jgi:DNA modification methylase
MNKIICADVFDGLRQIPDGSVHLIVTSPPFNVGIEYPDHDDRMVHASYLDWMKSVWSECHRVLVSGGRICINIDATMNLEKGGAIERVHPLHVDFTNQLRDLGYIYRAEICWTKQNAPGKDTAWGSYCLCSNPHIRRNSEYIVIASKEHLTLEGDFMKCDLTKEEFHEWTLSEWRMAPASQKKGHPVPYPPELVRRCVKLFSYVGNTVLDPFNGSGTTTSVAFEHGRNYIGIDNSEQYCRIARKSIGLIKQQYAVSGGYSFVPSPEIVRLHSQKKANLGRRDIYE